VGSQIDLPNANFRGATDTLHLIEKFKRVADDTIEYYITVDDATVWSRPWTLMIPLKGTGESMFEFACHEGNYRGEGNVARRLETEYQSAAESVREGLDETLTVLTLNLSPRLRRSLVTTNAAERLLSRTPQREAQREALARWPNDAAVGSRRRPRSRQGLPSTEGVCWQADARRCAPRTRQGRSVSPALRRSDRSRSRQPLNLKPEGHPPVIDTPRLRALPEAGSTDCLNSVLRPLPPGKIRATANKIAVNCRGRFRARTP
jgi:hypothetical protein